MLQTKPLLPHLLLTLPRSSTWPTSLSLPLRPRLSNLKAKVRKYFNDLKTSILFLFLEEVPPPTKNDEAERLIRRMILLTQKGEWDLAVENLKVKPSQYPVDPHVIDILVDTGGDGVSE